MSIGHENYHKFMNIYLLYKETGIIDPLYYVLFESLISFSNFNLFQNIRKYLIIGKI